MLFILQASIQASVHINATEDLIMAPLSDIITLEDLDMPLSTTIDELLRPLSDIIPPYYNSELFPNVNTIGVHTPPLVISSISDYGKFLSFLSHLFELIQSSFWTEPNLDD